MTEEGTSDTAPFAFIVMDMFSPFVTKEGRKELKRYGAVFTCLSSRAIRLEAVHSVETVPFIMCMWRFIECCGNMKMLRYDNDSNFIATEKELKKGIVGMDHSHIGTYSQNERNIHQLAETLVEFGNVKLGSEGSVDITALNSWLQFKQSSLTEAILDSMMITVEALADSTSEAVVSP